MTAVLDGARVAFLFTDGVERVELQGPLNAVTRAGGRPTFVSLEGGTVQTFDHLSPADTVQAVSAAADVTAEDFDALILPGGVANPDRLRTDEHAVRFVRGFFDAEKVVGVICHGPWTLIEADVVRGRRLTSWPSLQTDLRNAGATWVDEEVCLDGRLISSRKPDDLPAFCDTVLDAIANAPRSDGAGRSPSDAPSAEPVPGSAALR